MAQQHHCGTRRPVAALDRLTTYKKGPALRPVVPAHNDDGTCGIGAGGDHPFWSLNPAGQKALVGGNALLSRPKAGTGAMAVRTGFGPHGVAVTDTIRAYGGRERLTGWQVEVNHAVKETVLSFDIDAVLVLATTTSEVCLFELDNGSMPQAQLRLGAPSARCRVWQGAPCHGRLE
ncbi:replication-relaxation family protein [Streptomyces sp. NPDC055210]